MEGHNAIISLSSKSTSILTAIMSNSASHFGDRNGFNGGGGGANSFPGGAIAPPRYIVKKGTASTHRIKLSMYT